MNQLLDEYLDAGKDLEPMEMAREALERFPDDVAEYRRQITDRGLRNVAREAIRNTQRKSEDQQILPGFDVPQWFTVRTEGGHVHRPITGATMATWEEHCKVLEEHIEAASTKHTEQRDLVDRCYAAGATEQTPVLDAIAMLETNTTNKKENK